MPKEYLPSSAAVDATSPRVSVDPWRTAEANTSDKVETIPSLAGLLSAPLDAGELGWMAHYRILKVLGRGGMGIVFEAEDTHLQRRVALKAILPDYAGNPVARERFLREARACAALKSDHIVTIYQVGQDRDIPYLAMEILQGQTLEHQVESAKPLPPREVIRIGREIADGLAAAHAHGLIHRDIKPANIWLEASNGRVKLLDFGLARTVGIHSELTQTGLVVGTPAFMSPEQGRGDPLDERSDLFSVGAVLYTLCTGRRPFEASGVMGVLTALATKAPRHVRDLNPDVPQELAALVMRLLEKDPAERPASAAAVRDALHAMQGESGIRAAVDPVVTRTPVAVVAATTMTPPPARARRRIWPIAIGMAIALSGIAALSIWLFTTPGPEEKTEPNAPAAAPHGPPIRIGVLHSRTGTMSISERAVSDAVLLAVEEINEHGGIFGRPVDPVLADGQSDEAIFASQAEKLITTDNVCTIFGCWTSASRKAVLPIVEQHNHLLVYPVQYEGMEESHHAVYLGPVPNQQILPALRWLAGFEGRTRWFLVGSDYVFPATANAVIRDEAKAKQHQIVGEEYLPLGGDDVAAVVRKIADAQPDLIVNTINGDTNVVFLRALRRAGITSKRIPMLSFSVSEQELSALPAHDTVGDYVASNYFQSLRSPANRKFTARFAKRFGEERVISGPMEAAYAGVHVWAQAVRLAGRDDAHAIRDALKGLEFDAPQGMIRIDAKTLHTAQVARIGRIDGTGRILEIYSSPERVEPEPFPPSRSQKEWQTLLNDLHRRWGGRWSNINP